MRCKFRRLLAWAAVAATLLLGGLWESEQLDVGIAVVTAPASAFGQAPPREKQARRNICHGLARALEQPSSWPALHTTIPLYADSAADCCGICRPHGAQAYHFRRGVCRCILPGRAPPGAPAALPGPGCQGGGAAQLLAVVVTMAASGRVIPAAPPFVRQAVYRIGGEAVAAPDGGAPFARQRNRSMVNVALARQEALFCLDFRSFCSVGSKDVRVPEPGDEMEAVTPSDLARGRTIPRTNCPPDCRPRGAARDPDRRAHDAMAQHSGPGTDRRRKRAVLAERRQRLARQLQQNLDLIRVLKHAAAAKCFGHCSFVLMEDDFTWCESAGDELRWAMRWSHAHWDRWRSLRLGLGANGLVIKCEELPVLIAYLEAVQHNGGVDWLLSAFYSQSALVYQSNLWLHDDVQASTMAWESSESALRGKSLAKCGDVISGSGLSRFAMFDVRRCTGSAFSPCSDGPAALDAPGSPERSRLKQVNQNAIGNANSQGVVAVLSDAGSSCDVACMSIGRQCQGSRMAFRAINSCKLLSSVTAGNCSVSCELGYGVSPSEPDASQGRCFLSVDPSASRCDAISWLSAEAGVSRLCPCVDGAAEGARQYSLWETAGVAVLLWSVAALLLYHACQEDETEEEPAPNGRLEKLRREVSTSVDSEASI